mgnify:CR=1 FL=1
MIPQGWQEKTLGEVLNKVRYTSKIQSKLYKDKGKYPIISQEDVFISGYWDDANDVYHVKHPVVIFGDHTKVVKYVNFDFVLGADGVKILDPKEDVSAKFLYYWVQYVPLRNLGYARHYKLLSQKIIYFPDKNEQERIVAKLDKAFEAIDKAKTIAETNLKNAKELFTSMLDTLCHDKKVNWTQGRLDNYFVLQRGFDLPKQDRKKGQYPLVSSNGITDFINTYKIKRPVVVTGRSGTIGSVHYVDENSWPLNTTLYVKDFKNNVPKYIFYYLKSLNLAEFSSGAGVPTLNRNYIHELIISFPLQNEQQKIVEKLDKLQEQTKQLEAIYIKQIKDLDELKQSILQKAFRGEL